MADSQRFCIFPFRTCGLWTTRSIRFILDGIEFWLLKLSGKNVCRLAQSRCKNARMWVTEIAACAAAPETRASTYGLAVLQSKYREPAMGSVTVSVLIIRITDSPKAPVVELIGEFVQQCRGRLLSGSQSPSSIGKAKTTLSAVNRYSIDSTRCFPTLLNATGLSK